MATFHRGIGINVSAVRCFEDGVMHGISWKAPANIQRKGGPPSCLYRLQLGLKVKWCRWIW